MAARWCHYNRMSVACQAVFARWTPADRIMDIECASPPKRDFAFDTIEVYCLSMSYLVFARKYRPQRFEDIVAQDHVTRTLQNAVKNDRVGSGYLFCGPRGTGKTTTARVLAKALNCVDGPTPTPCGKCSNCIEIAAGTSLDVLEIDAASNTGVDDIRTLRENVRYLPTGGKKRIYIIDEVHRLSGAAFDALLKTLEEPPPHVIFMFATTEPMKVPETILSRTQRFDMRRVGVSDLIRHMRWIAEQEKLDIDDAALVILARKADGSVRDSLSLLDQIAAFAGEKITKEIVISALGLVDRRLLQDFTAAIASGDSKAVLGHIREIFESGTDAGDFVGELLEHFRQLLLLTTDRQTGDLMQLAPEELAELNAQAERFQVGDVVRLIGIGAALDSDLKAKSGLNERLVLEVAAIKMAEMESTVSLEQVLRHLNQNPQLRPPARPATQKKKAEPASRPSSTRLKHGPEPTPEPTRSYPQRNVSLTEIQAGWPAFLNNLRRQSRMLASQLAMAEVRSIADNRVLAVFGPSGSAAKRIVDKTASLSLIGEALSHHFEAGLRIGFDLDPNARPPRSEAGADRERRIDVKQLMDKSPRIRALVEKVDGEIIGVRKANDK